ncbi:MAG: noncanonical pyrimidine nucleotidase, YjjG family [Candidatus Aminicenantes bacterium]|nr:noncanonical pyrimidine nucleotidase, YjjG family [Candidatus Aminicenantes bacterium]
MAGTYKAVFFDADDTLFDYSRAERTALRACLREFGLKIGLAACVEAYRRHNRDMWRAFERGEVTQGTLRVERFRRLAAEFGIDGLPLEKIGLYYLEALAGQPQLLPGALTTVRALAKKFPLALITNGIASVQRRRFSASPITRYFQAVVISEEAGMAKPDPRIFEPALRTIGVSAGDVLYVGDSVTSDMAAARNAGMDFCWFNPGRLPVPDGHAPVFNIARLQELFSRRTM